MEILSGSTDDTPTLAHMALPSGLHAGSHTYRAFGMYFTSPVPVPGLSSVVPGTTESSIMIQFGNVPDAIATPEYCDATVQASSSECLFEIPGRLRFYVDEKEGVLVESIGSVEPSVFWGMLLSLAMSIIGLRRGYVPLHASAVSGSGVSVAFAGQSGSGKSTTAATLIHMGHQAHSDDLCLVQMGSGGAAMIGAGLPELRLWDEAVEVLGWSAGSRIGYVENISKAVYRLKNSSVSSLPLGRVYALEFSDDASRHGIHRLQGFDAMAMLMDCLRVRPGLITRGLRLLLFEGLAQISREVEVFRFCRPWDSQRLQYWTERLAEHIGISPEPAQ